MMASWYEPLPFLGVMAVMKRPYTDVNPFLGGARFLVETRNKKPRFPYI
jgi:hypothetical protein